MGTILAPIMQKFCKYYANIIHVFKHFQIYIVDLSMISFYSGMEAKRNY